MIKIVLYETLTDKQGFFALSTEKNYFSKDESISELLNITYAEYKERLNNTFIVVNQDQQMYVKFDDDKDKMVERFKNEFAAEMVLAEMINIENWNENFSLWKHKLNWFFSNQLWMPLQSKYSK